MNHSLCPIATARQLASLLVIYWRRWLVPAVAAAVLVGFYAVAVHRPVWKASQALAIRNEAANNQLGPGKFGHSDEMKTVQETLLQLTTSRGVLSAALAEVGPLAGRGSVDFPGETDVDDLRKAIKLAPPPGVEFGASEVFYLTVEDHDRNRAIALNHALCRHLQASFRQLRDAKAQSMIDELTRSVHLAKADLAESTARLTVVETQVGSDLAELRNLQDRASGDSGLQRIATEIQNEIRQTKAARTSAEQALALLEKAQRDPATLVATPNQLLESQPGLKRLKDGLVDAQLRTATLKGHMSEAHPLVQAARHAEQETARNLHAELAVAIGGMQTDLRSNGQRLALLEDQLAQTTARQRRIAELRAEYANLVAENARRTTLLERAEHNLAEARAAHAGANAASLLSRIDAPDAGARPCGPGRATILLLGAAAGLLLGFGILALTVPSLPSALPAPAPAVAAAPVVAYRPSHQPLDILSLKRKPYGAANGF